MGWRVEDRHEEGTQGRTINYRDENFGWGS
jgi:hypothetical protein